jgi:hypothetical protein
VQGQGFGFRYSLRSVPASRLFVIRRSRILPATIRPLHSPTPLVLLSLSFCALCRLEFIVVSSAFPVSLRSRVLWCRQVRPGYWCIAFPQSCSSGLAHHFRSGGCSGFAVRPCPPWRRFPAAVCVGFRPPSSWLSALRGVACRPVRVVVSIRSGRAWFGSRLVGAVPLFWPTPGGLPHRETQCYSRSAYCAARLRFATIGAVVPPY